MTLRQAQSKDLDAVLALLKASKLPADGVADALPDFIVAEEAGVLVGAIGMERYERYGLLRSAAVSSDWRDKGVGTLLVERLLETARACGVTALYLLTTTAEG